MLFFVRLDGSRRGDPKQISAGPIGALADFAFAQVSFTMKRSSGEANMTLLDTSPTKAGPAKRPSTIDRSLEPSRKKKTLFSRGFTDDRGSV